MGPAGKAMCRMCLKYAAKADRSFLYACLRDRRQIRMADASQTNCRASERLFPPSVPRTPGCGAVQQHLLAPWGGGEPRNGAQLQGPVSPRPPPALCCGLWRAEAQHLLHRWWMDALRSTLTSAGKGDSVCQHLDHPTALHSGRE